MTVSSRELATAILLLGACAWGLTKPDVRRSGLALVRAALQIKLLVPFALFVAWVAMWVRLGWAAHLWQADLTKDTLIWTATSGAVLFVNFEKSSAGVDFLRRTIVGLVEVAVFLEFFVNLSSLNLVAELLLQPLLVLSVGVSVFAATNADHRPAKRLADVLLAGIGLSLLAYTGWELRADWPLLDKGLLTRQWLLPIWLTLAALPFVYALNLYAAYESAFGLIASARGGQRANSRVRVAMFAELRSAARDVQRLTWHWATQLGEAETFAAARAVVKAFRESLRAGEQAECDEQDRLERYAGSDETDPDGRRVDRREFRATQAALDWVATCHMGQYGKHGAGYWRDLMGILADDAVRHGLPPDAKIEMAVSDDGQSWYAWRRTITGWCFAIGASGPPPDQWRYDGREPPGGHPGTHTDWGGSAFSDEVSKNWY